MAGSVAVLRGASLHTGAFRRLLSGRNLIIVGVAVVIAYIGAVPLGFLLYRRNF